ncbi:MAG TPA: tetratricopeptide repeat protein, partial [Pyrinomonadaceae bacterium]|nr:tetratricopeptide repeat protein [Pyrinomonadaceae bacterium]
KWPEAIDTYKIAIRLDANYAAAYGGLGDAYFNTGKWEEGLAAYKEQARLDPNNAKSQHDLGYAYNAMGRHGEAFAPLVKATSLDPGYAEAYYGIGFAYLKGADFEKSVPFFKSAIKLQPDYSDAYFGMGQAYARLGQADAANEQARKLTTIDAKLGQRLTKEIQTTLAAAGNSAPPSAAAPGQNVIRLSPTSARASEPAAGISQPDDKPVAQLAETLRPPAQQTQSVVNTQPAPQAFAPPKQDPPAQQSPPSSRQLEQLPASPTKTAGSTPPSSPAASVVSQVDQIKSLPVGAKRWALVIGVDKYMDPQISPLKGSDNDARLIADALVRYAGFPPDQVILLSTAQPMERQPTRVNILRRLSNLSTAVPKDGLLLISFAGHGMERGGQAFLMPSDAQISDQISFLEETAISLNRVKERIKDTGVGQVLVLLDACRNDPGGRADAPNPLSNAYTSAFNFDVRNREVQAFATVYATGIGQRAYEYTEKKQGYFSWALVEGLKGAAANEKGEITLSQLVKHIQDTVPKRITIDLGSTKQQRPFAIIEGYRAEQLVLAVTNSASMARGSDTPNIAVVDPAAIELSYWETIKNSNSPDDFKSYLEKYPDGQFASLAKSRANFVRPPGNSGGGDSPEMSYWNAIKDSQNPSDFRAYISKFPQGLFVDLANNRIVTLDAKASGRSPAAAAGLQPTGPVTLKDIEISFRSSMYDETIRIGSRYLEATPNDGAAHAYLGLALLAKKDADNAVLHLERAMVLGQSINFPLKRLREPLFGHSFDDVVINLRVDSLTLQQGKTAYVANYSALPESRIGNYKNQCPIAFLKGAFAEGKGKPGDKTFNLFPSTSTLQPVQQGNMMINIAACNDDGMVPTTVIKLIYRLAAAKR